MSLTPIQAHELGRCYARPAYFVQHFCQIYDANSGAWIPFQLWPEQRATLETIASHRLCVILKARQLGMSWAVLSYALWQMIFRPAATVLIFSRRETEALYLLSWDRLRGMYARLPAWLRSGHAITLDSVHEWGLANGSIIRGFPTTAGDSYTAGLAIVDEADLVPDLNFLMRAVKPTIDNGGQMILVSRADKTQPASEFKSIYRGAQAGENGWTPVFLPWHVHPARNQAWYEEQRRDIVARTGAEDDLHELYPNTPEEALAPRSLDKRLPHAWLTNCYQSLPAQNTQLVLPGLSIFTLPIHGQPYVIGADPAEGNPNSDESAACVLDVETGEEVARLAGRFESSTFAGYLDALGRYYNDAPLLVERNNHGHAVLLWLRDNSRLRLLTGRDGHVGWQTTSVSKALLYSEFADALRDEQVTIHSLETYLQLASIEGATLSAPQGMHDDRAMSIVLAQMGRAQAQAAAFDLAAAFAYRANPSYPSSRPHLRGFR